MLLNPQYKKTNKQTNRQGQHSTPQNLFYHVIYQSINPLTTGFFSSCSLSKFDNSSSLCSFFPTCSFPKRKHPGNPSPLTVTTGNVSWLCVSNYCILTATYICVCICGGVRVICIYCGTLFCFVLLDQFTIMLQQLFHSIGTKESTIATVTKYHFSNNFTVWFSPLVHSWIMFRIR